MHIYLCQDWSTHSLLSSRKKLCTIVIGKLDELKLIKFLTRYGYATRAAPFCKLHGAYARYELHQ